MSATSRSRTSAVPLAQVGLGPKSKSGEWVGGYATLARKQIANGKKATTSAFLEFAATEHGRKGKVIASEDVKAQISRIGINKCARESGFDRKNFVRKLIREIPVKRNSYAEFVRWLGGRLL